MEKYNLKAEKRKVFGRKVNSLRREGILPANVYGKKVKSLAIQFALKDFRDVYKEAGETGIVEIVLGSLKKPALIHHVQVDPVTDLPLHVDFLQVDLKQKVSANVPVELVGESPAEKTGLGTVVQYIDEIEVEALPAELPERFEIDLSKLKEVDMAVFVKDLTVDSKKVEIKTDPDQILVKVEPPRKEEEEPVVAEEEEKEGETPVEEGAEKAEETPTEEEGQKPEEKKGEEEKTKGK